MSQIVEPVVVEKPKRKYTKKPKTVESEPVLSEETAFNCMVFGYWFMQKMEASGMQIEKEKMLALLGIGAAPEYIQEFYGQFMQDGNTIATEVAQHFQKPVVEAEPAVANIELKPKRKYVRKPKTPKEEPVV